MKLAATTALLVYLCLDGISAFTPPTTIRRVSVTKISDGINSASSQLQMSDVAGSYLDSLNDGGSASSSSNGIVENKGKIFTWSSLLRDHTRFITVLPSYLNAYIRPKYSLKPTTIESIMLTVNSYNTCPYCTGLHGQLARMSGLQSTSLSNSEGENAAEVIYAKTFALESGRGSIADTAYDTLINEIGSKHATSVKALCWALLWGKTTGNTINNARDKLLKGQFNKVTSLDIFVLCYYGPLFAVIGVLNKILSVMPTIPKAVSAGLGATLWVPQAINITPLGIVSLLVNKGIV